MHACPPGPHLLCFATSSPCSDDGESFLDCVADRRGVSCSDVLRIRSQSPIFSWGFVQVVLSFVFWATVPPLVVMLFSTRVCGFTGEPVGSLREASKYVFVHKSARFLVASVATWVVASRSVLSESDSALRCALVDFSVAALARSLCGAFARDVGRCVGIYALRQTACSFTYLAMRLRTCPAVPCSEGPSKRRRASRLEINLWVRLSVR